MGLDIFDLPATDLRRWRLRTSEGSNRWNYISEEEAQQHPQSTAEKYFLGLLTVCTVHTSSSTQCYHYREHATKNLTSLGCSKPTGAKVFL